MPRAKKQSLPHLEAQPVTVLTSGAGELSPEDLAAIRGDVPEDPALEPLSEQHSALTFEPASPEEVSTGARLATLEAWRLDVEQILASHAVALRSHAEASTSRHAFDSPLPVRPATPAEESAYCRMNFEARGDGRTPFDGIEEWRAAGSPGLAQ